MALNKSASEPGLGTKGSASLKAAAAQSLMNSGASTTSLYEKMKAEGKFREQAPHLPAAGRSINVPLADSSERDLQPETYFPLPPTPVNERRFRKISHGPGEIHVHYGLKDQKLPAEDFRYGIRGVKGSGTAEAMKAGQLVGVAEYKNSVAERNYESTKREPLGTAHIRGHNLVMLPEGYGNPSGVPVDAKKVIFPLDQPQDPEDIRAQYRFTHNSYAPGERICRNYSFPEACENKNFRFGANPANAVEGAGAALALNYEVDDEGNVNKTRMVQRVCEDYRNVAHPKLFVKTHMKQGADGPPINPEHRFGIKSGVSDYTAESCIKGYYSLKEQLPDQDLGRCTKPGRRNVTTETRAFGVPSVRTDIPAPHPGKRSVADVMSYGDEPGAAALLNPQRFDNRGVPDREFLIRRPKDELEAIVRSVMPSSSGPEVDFDALWDEAEGLFDDGMPLVSVDAILYVHSQKIENHVTTKLATAGLSGHSSMRA